MHRTVGFFMWLLFSNGFCFGHQRLDQNEGSMRYALDGMQLLLEGQGTFDDVLYNNLVACADKFDLELLAAENAQWQGMMDYAASEGKPGDPWLPCYEVTEGSGNWIEFNCTFQEMGEMPIYEPCNYASNIAYYHTSVEICQRPSWDLPEDYVLALVRVFSYLAQGSSFFHGSETSVGGSADVRLNDLFIYIAYQATVDLLEPQDDTVLHELSYTPRAKSSIEITEELRDIYINQPVGTWDDALDAMDVPSIFLGFCAFLVVPLSVLMDYESLHDFTLAVLTFLGIEDMEESLFCLNDALPAIEAATADIRIDEVARNELQKSVFGVMIKLLYACLWQEELIPADVLESSAFNTFGAAFLPVLNDFANSLLPEQEFPHYNPDFQHGVNVYPGEDHCNPAPLPHAKWHLQTGIALGDVAHAANYVSKIIQAKTGVVADETGGASAISGVSLGTRTMMVVITVMLATA